jgi:hypothetical protein
MIKLKIHDIGKCKKKFVLGVICVILEAETNRDCVVLSSTLFIFKIAVFDLVIITRTYIQ